MTSVDIEPDVLKVKLQIWDTSGPESFRDITRSYCRGAAGCVATAVYDVTSRTSFDNVMIRLDDVRSIAPNSGTVNTVIMLVGTKTDLEDRRMVATAEGDALAEREEILFGETREC